MTIHLLLQTLSDNGSPQCDVTFQRIEEPLDSETEEPHSIVSQDYNTPTTDDDQGAKSRQSKYWTKVNKRMEEYQDPEDDPKQYERIRLHHLTIPGGVDYKAELMVQYVAEIAQRIVLPGSSGSPTLMNWISALLKTSRLRSADIPAALRLLAWRTNMLKAAGIHIARDGEMWRSLAANLLLASKLLDNESLQEQLWSEAVGTLLFEMKEREAAWLDALKRDLSFDAESGVFRVGFQNWKDFREVQGRYLKSLAEDLLLFRSPI